MTGKNKTRLVGWHPSDPAAVDWLDAEVGRRGGGRGAQSAILDEALAEYRARRTAASGRGIVTPHGIAELHPANWETFLCDRSDGAGSTT